MQQASRRREQLYGAFVDLAALLYLEALSHAFEAAKIVPLWALISRTRLIKARCSLSNAEAVMVTIVETYIAPNVHFDLTGEAARQKFDRLRDFTETGRADLVRR